MRSIKNLGLAVFIGVSVSACVVQPAPPPRVQYHREEHPAYLHALSDLRAARWLVAHRSAENYAMSQDEQTAIDEINAAIGEIKQAAYEDGKDVDDAPPADAKLNHSGRLHRALELLHKTHDDVAREEDDPAARGLQHRSLEHITLAARSIERALADIDR